jgi:hypothetical protein
VPALAHALVQLFGDAQMLISKKFEVIYYNNRLTESHRYWETWDLTDLYCVFCGVKGVWQSASEDYEAGPTLFCDSCGYHHTINYFYQASDHPELVNNQEWQRLKALRS